MVEIAVSKEKCGKLQTRIRFHIVPFISAHFLLLLSLSLLPPPSLPDSFSFDSNLGCNSIIVHLFSEFNEAFFLVYCLLMRCTPLQCVFFVGCESGEGGERGSDKMGWTRYRLRI